MRIRTHTQTHLYMYRCRCVCVCDIGGRHGRRRAFDAGQLNRKRVNTRQRDPVRRPCMNYTRRPVADYRRCANPGSRCIAADRAVNSGRGDRGIGYARQTREPQRRRITCMRERARARVRRWEGKKEEDNIGPFYCRRRPSSSATHI